MFIFEAIVCITSLLGYGYLFIHSIGLKSPKQFWDGPGSFPSVLSALCFLLCIVWLIDLLLNKKKRKSQEQTTVSSQKQQGIVNKILSLWHDSQVRNLSIIVVLTVLYILVLIKTIGFVISTVVFLFTTIFLFYEKKWLTALIVSFVTTGVVYLLFTYIFHLPLPH